MKLSVKDPLFLDNHLLVFNKPAGLPTQPSPSGGNSLEEEGKKWVKKKFQKPGNVFLTPIHRLDRPVSGLVLFARTSKSLSRLQAQMRARQIEKTYYAQVEGDVKESNGLLCHFLAHGNHKAYLTSKEEGKEARLSYVVISKRGKTSLLEICLHTGRYHQIRIQLATIGHPICGDVKYGAKKKKGEGIDLHHGKLSFFHPITNEKVIVTSPYFW
jgi:23S rRNA pseudouridine1911/1915/1917 synthase